MRTPPQSGDFDPSEICVYTRAAFSGSLANRIVELEIVGVHRYTFTYGPLGRCLLTEEEDLSGGSADFLRSTHHLYEGTLPIADYVVPADASPETLRLYTRGPDLSRSTLSAAGGTAGILALATGEPGSTTATYGYAYDGKGNVLGLFDNTGSFAVTYDYDPFGNVTVLSGDRTLNPFRFSTQRYFPEANLHRYLFRFYDPEAGRWLSRDPIGERGGLNLYGFVGNEPVRGWDYLGLARSEYEGKRSGFISRACAAFAAAKELREASDDPNEYQDPRNEERLHLEYGTYITQAGKEFSYTEPHRGSATHVSFFWISRIGDPPLVGIAHSHLSVENLPPPPFGREWRPEEISLDDEFAAEALGVPNFVSVPSGDLLVYNPDSGLSEKIETKPECCDNE